MSLPDDRVLGLARFGHGISPSVVLRNGTSGPGRQLVFDGVGDRTGVHPVSVRPKARMNDPRSLIDRDRPVGRG